METFLQTLIQGLAIGSIYGLVALGFAMIYNARGILNFAQGEFLMMGAFAGLLFLSTFNLPLIVGIPFTLVVCAVYGYLVDRIIFRKMMGAHEDVLLISTIGLSYALKNLYRVIYGADPFRFPAIFGKKAINIGTLRVVPENIGIIVIAGLLIYGLNLLFKKTFTGKALRAVAQDSETARLMGINVEKTISLTFMLVFMIAGLGGVLVGPIYNIDTNMGLLLGIKGFAAAVLGGITNVFGAFLGGVVIGIAESVGGVFISSGYKDAIAFIILILILIVKPTGLLGEKLD